MYQILLVPNITWQKNIDQDSYVKVISDIIGELNNIRDDLHWHSPLPSHSKLLDLPNVTQYKLTMPSYPNAMRGHFDYEAWKKIVDWKTKDFDLIYSHLPEWTPNIVNLITNITNIGRIPVVGYCHWFEIKEITNYDETYLMNNINGLLLMEKCGVNTEAQKQLVLKNVEDKYSEKTLRLLKNVLTPHYLGIPNDACVDDINENPEKIIVFNHRPQAYKDFPYFLSLMDKLWKQRQDFKVWVPLLDKSDREYIYTTSFDNKEEYYKHLQKCCCGYCPKQKYAGWSVSGTDMMMNGMPVLFWDADYYRELATGGAAFHTTDEEALRYFNEMLDNENNIRNFTARIYLEYTRENLIWKNRIKPINEMINEALQKVKPATDRSVKRGIISDFIRRKKKASKKEILDFLQWGVGIKFSSYRRYLLEQEDIDTIMVDGVEYYVTKDYKPEEENNVEGWF